MKKLLALFSILIVASVVVYNAMDWNETNATNEFTNEEQRLTVNPGEKKMMITDLGMV
jgi:hypothetical protein